VIMRGIGQNTMLTDRPAYIARAGAQPHMSNATVNDGRLAAAVDVADVSKAAPFALVIDDQENICRLVAEALAGVGVEYATYATARPAIASLDGRRPDVIFLDVALDQSDAIDVIKGLSEKRYTGVVQLMSGGRLALLEAMQRIGARYGLMLRPALQKPFRGDELQQAIVSMGLARRS
jgi:DNA-binding NtrC family response regulator